jgi:TonB-dependent SusC/RagA subfamily outer membrane receptor
MKIRSLSKILFSRFTLIVAVLMFFTSCKRVPSSGGVISSNEKKTTEINDGYTSQNTRNYTGSATEIENFQNNMTLDNYLKRVPGVLVRGEGARSQITIRGISSFVGDSSPLYVLNNSPFAGGFQELFYSINVNDIKSVSVLKDAASTGIYGSRATNGVIVIVLKNK